MSHDNYKLKYIKYKKKYNDLKKIKSSISNIINKIIIIPKEYNILSQDQKNLFKTYEFDSNTSKPISYIKNEYDNGLGGSNHNDIVTEINTNGSSFKTDSDNVLTKHIISPDEYFCLCDSDKAKYSINESDYQKFPNRVVPKNYKKITIA